MLRSLLVSVALLLCAGLGQALRLGPSSGLVRLQGAAAATRGSRSGSRLFMSSPAGGPGLDDSTKQFLDKVVSSNKVVLFMKGTALFPQCGFSNTAVRILDAVGTKFETVNVLDSDKIRNGIKVYSSWPTIPQLYVGGEFVGGSDIMIELYQNGQLAEMIEVANASG